MEVDSKVLTIEKLVDYFFLVPDFQREYVWRSGAPASQVDQFLDDIFDEFSESNRKKVNYFIGSLIVVDRNNNTYEVIDGQQRLTTISIILSAFRDYFQDLIYSGITISQDETECFSIIKNILYKYDLNTRTHKSRITLQYEDSRGYLESLISMKNNFIQDSSSSILRMQECYSRAMSFLKDDIRKHDKIVEFMVYFLNNVEMVIIFTKNISGALKIFETINQRGVGLNPMDLLKNMIFREAGKREFDIIKRVWKNITTELERCKEDDRPLRFLRYFLIARYHDGIIREDEIYSWLINKETKKKIKYHEEPISFVNELYNSAKKYSLLVRTLNEIYKPVSTDNYLVHISLIGKTAFRQHLMLLLAIKDDIFDKVIAEVSNRISVLIFYYIMNYVQAKVFERKFANWAKDIREYEQVAEIQKFLSDVIQPEINEQIRLFQKSIKTYDIRKLQPKYRIRFLFSMIENYLRKKGNWPLINVVNNWEIEHILPERKRGKHPDFENDYEYQDYLYRLGNITLLEGPINKSINMENDVEDEEYKWFQNKKIEYKKSAILMTELISDKPKIGNNTAFNEMVDEVFIHYQNWSKKEILDRQDFLYKIITSIWY